MLDPLTAASQAIAKFASETGFLSLGLASFFHGVGLPIPAEVLLAGTLAYVGQQGVSAVSVVLIFSLANGLGALVPYSACRLGGRKLVARFLKKDLPEESHLVHHLSNYGGLVIAFTRIIGFMRYASLIAAGLIPIPGTTVVIATTVGAALYTMLGIAVLKTGGISAVVLLLVLLVSAGLILKQRFKSP